VAQPISFTPPRPDPREELRNRLENAPVEHAEALLDFYALLDELHAHGVLQLVRGMVGATDKLVEVSVEAAKTDQSVRALRNMIILGKMLGSINPDLLQGIAVAAQETLGVSRRPAIEPPGLFALLSQFRHKELRRSIALINRFLEALGIQLSARGTTEKDN